MTDYKPSYLGINTRDLHERAEALKALASPCTLCPRVCGTIRRENNDGYCRTAFEPMVSSVQPHFGEEAPLTGTHGSGTIFFTNCNLGCIFCQNYDISHLGDGRQISVESLADAMLGLQSQGCHNINLVTPTHQAHSIVEAITIAIEGGLRLPIVYNTGSYDSLETLRLLEGIVDIYMPDLKFMDKDVSMNLAEAADYPDVSRKAIMEMHRQVGDLHVDSRGIATKGIIVRHLVLPDDLAGSREAFRFLAEDISTNTYLNIMAQYRPCWRAVDKPHIGKPLSNKDFTRAVSAASDFGIKRLD